MNRLPFHRFHGSTRSRTCALGMGDFANRFSNYSLYCGSVERCAIIGALKFGTTSMAFRGRPNGPERLRRSYEPHPFGSFRASHLRGRLPRQNAPVSALQFDATAKRNTKRATAT